MLRLSEVSTETPAAGSHAYCWMTWQSRERGIRAEACRSLAARDPDSGTIGAVLNSTFIPLTETLWQSDPPII